MRNRQRHRKKRIKGRASVTAIGAGQGRPIKRLKYVIDETVVTARMIGKGFGRDVFIRSSIAALLQQSQNYP